MWEPGTAALPGDCLVRHVVRHAFPRARVSSMEEKSLAFPRSDPPQGVAPCVSHRLGFLVSIRVSGAMLAGERIAIRQPGDHISWTSFAETNAYANQSQYLSLLTVKKELFGLLHFRSPSS